MLACASLPAITPSNTGSACDPVVFIDGQPQATLTVRRLKQQGPLGIRSIELSAIDSTAHGREAVLALPRGLIDGQTRWEVLAAGRLTAESRHVAVEQDRTGLTLEDDWGQALERDPERTWQVVADQSPQQRTGGTLAVGVNPNRSTDQHLVAGQMIHVLQEDGHPWTVGQALQTLSVFYKLELSAAALSASARDAKLSNAIDLQGPLRKPLEDLLRSHSLVVQRSFLPSLTHPRERRSVRSSKHGRRITLPQQRPGQTHHSVLRFDADTSSPAARQWIAQGERPAVESTFTLQPGWNTDLEGQPDSEYGRATSSDFSRFANVYRLWLLNEDGQRAGPAFDLAGFFNLPDLSPTPIPFGNAVTLDDNARPLRPVVEFSTDSGSTWSRFTQALRVLNDRAEVYLDPAVLDAGVLVAAQNHALIIRVTASLTRPYPAEVSRWAGNPFAATDPPLRLDLSRRFLFRRVDPQSIHHAAVQSGQLSADQHDDTQAMTDWLLDRMDQPDHAGVSPADSAALTLSGTRPELRVGDRLNTLGLYNGDHDPRRFSRQRDARVTEVRCDFTKAVTTLFLEL